MAAMPRVKVGNNTDAVPTNCRGDAIRSTPAVCWEDAFRRGPRRQEPWPCEALGTKDMRYNMLERYFTEGSVTGWPAPATPQPSARESRSRKRNVKRSLPGSIHANAPQHQPTPQRIRFRAP